MTHHSLTLLLGNGGPALHEQVRALAPDVRIITPEQVKEQPDLLAEVTMAYGGLGRDQIGQATNLRWLQTAGAGVNGLVTPEIAASDLVITNASGIHAEPITEHMFGMLLVVTRRLKEAWEQQQTRQWRGGYNFDANVTMLAGKMLGVLGVGAIGGHSARVGKAFGMRVVGLRRGAEPHPDVEQMFSPNDKHAFLGACDVIMNSLPLTEKTRGFLGEAEFAAMKPGVIILNTGRGATIDTNALLDALGSGQVGAALLDVTDPEPLPADHPLWTAPNVFITPHYSGAHPTYDERADAIFLDNLRRFLSGESLRNVVDKREGY